MSPSDLARFWGWVNTDAQGGCWLWLGTLDKDGYGTLHLRRTRRRAARVAYAYWRGLIPAGYVVNHICHVRACVNPQHLEAITASAHSLLDQAAGAINARKAVCKEGHPYDRSYGGQRYCSICDQAKSRRLRAKWRAEERDAPLLTAPRGHGTTGVGVGSTSGGADGPVAPLQT